MIAVDTNILVYAHRSDSPWHRIAKTEVLALAEKRRAWAIPWPCVHEFFAIVYPPPDLHAANPACGSARPGNRMARIAQPGVAVGVGWILGTSCQDSEIVSHCRTSGTRCPDSRPLYASQRRPSVDGGSRLQSISRARDRKSPRVLSLPARLWKNSLLDHPRPVDDDVQRGLLLLSFRHDLLSPIGDDEALSVVDQGSRHPRG